MLEPRRGGIIIENGWIIIRNPEGVKLLQRRISIYFYISFIPSGCYLDF
jgi:hypothetical protein